MTLSTNGHNNSAINGTTDSTATSAAKHLRNLIFNNDGKIVVAPGVYDGFSARVALEVGFDCLYMVRLLSLNQTLIKAVADYRT